MTLTRSLCLLAVLLAESVLVPACVMEEVPLEQSSAQVVRPNGKRLNGKRLNGKRLNGKRLNGTAMGGEAMTGLRAQRGELVAEVDPGITVSGAALVGTTFTGTLTSGEAVSLYLAEVVADNAIETISLYHFSLWTANDGWADACEGGGGAAILNGYWDESEGTATGGDHVDDPDGFTLACEGFALAKCVEMGYRPWDGLGDFHQACTRMLRADYCGDGTTHTEDGTEINVWDALGIQARDPLGWEFEAEWSSDGARCISRTRLDQLDSYCPQGRDETDRKTGGIQPSACVSRTLMDYVQMACPGRARWLSESMSCGPDFPSSYMDTYMMDEASPSVATTDWDWM